LPCWSAAYSGAVRAGARGAEVSSLDLAIESGQIVSSRSDGCPVMDETPQAISCRCCIVGGGPAGMMLGLLLARAGVHTVVLEKHADFFRDFRGDELGLLDEFLKLPHQKVRLLKAKVGDTELPLADFAHLPTHAKFLAFMPQWDFIDFISSSLLKNCEI